MQVSSELVDTIRNPSLLLQNASDGGGNSVQTEPLPIPTTVMSDDHSKLAPLLPIPNRTVKRLCADDSVHTYVKVGHRQTPYKVKTLRCKPGGFCFMGLIATYLNEVTGRRQVGCC